MVHCLRQNYFVIPNGNGLFFFRSPSFVAPAGHRNLIPQPLFCSWPCAASVSYRMYLEHHHPHTLEDPRLFVLWAVSGRWTISDRMKSQQNVKFPEVFCFFYSIDQRRRRKHLFCNAGRPWNALIHYHPVFIHFFFSPSHVHYRRCVASRRKRGVRSRVVDEYLSTQSFQSSACHWEALFLWWVIDFMETVILSWLLLSFCLVFYRVKTASRSCVYTSKRAATCAKNSRPSCRRG